MKETRSNGLEAIYSYDSLRNNIQIQYFRDGRLYYVIKYDYNEKAQQIHYTTSSYPGWHNYTLFDRQGNLAEFLRFDEQRILTQKIKYFYNRQNKLIRTEEFNEVLNEPENVYVTTYK
ncbi:hypothetical protein [Chryseolinea lacunae]|uniref:Uncharacterized protein n=1 Tax=Chryseolinea lacunae TaxID=2801331 RepID=A0ABS1L1X4_9BACT|nr:hypothetical protein [Chryseolinea lacunae]MBL0745691.1 hypothetical protein [Chryseolinea lacunae]